MKTKLFFLATVFCIASCTIKEDRLPCPCLLKLDFGTAARYSQQYSVKGWGYGEPLFGESVNLEDWPGGWPVRVPKGEIEYSAYSALTECVTKGNSVIAPEGKGFDRIWACHRHLSLSEEETVDRVEPHKQWAQVTIMIRDLPDGELTTEVTGNYIGFSLTDLSPVAGMFRTSVSNEGRGIISFNIPRQDDNELTMTLVSDGTPVKSYDLGRMIEGTGYDWHAEDLDDIYLGMDYNKLEMEIFIEPWQGGDVYNEVKSVSIVPFTELMDQVRSSYSWTDSEINELELILEDDSGRMSTYYFPEFNGPVTLSLEAGRSYQIMAAANVGREIDASMMKRLDDGVWKPDFSNISWTGIPMTGSASATILPEGKQKVTVRMTRLLARIDFSIDMSFLKYPGELKIKSVCVYDGSSRKYDHASAKDLSTVQNGGTISMYTYENMQGNLLPNNKDPWEKVPSNIGQSASRCTWIEVQCSYDAGARSSDDITYRMYLGKNTTSNFDVQRNKVYSLTLIPSEEEIYGERGSWKISSSGWTEQFTYRKRLEIQNGGDIGVGDKAVFEVKMYTDTFLDGSLYSKDITGVTMSNDELEWGFGSSPGSMTATSEYASIDSHGTITGLMPGQCTVICILPDDATVFDTRTVNVHDTTDGLSIDLDIQWGQGNYQIGFEF